MSTNTHTNTHTTTSPARARTDLRDSGASTPRGTAATRKAGIALAAGTALWAVTSGTLGFEPDASWKIAAGDLTGLAFQAGIMALLHVQIRTRATGTSKRAGIGLKVERVLLSIAMLWSLLHAVIPSQRDAAWMHAIDMFWPISMLGMFFIGIKVAIAGRWRGPARLWSLLAETWAPVCVPILGIFGHDIGDVVAAGHLLLGYTVLGLILAKRPELTEQR